MQAETESNPPRRQPPYGIYAYTAREWDPEIGLFYYRARYYDPRIGRFISEDPLGGRHLAPLSITLDAEANARGETYFGLASVSSDRLLEPIYAYAANDPVNRFDPEGKSSGFWHWAHRGHQVAHLIAALLCLRPYEACVKRAKAACASALRPDACEIPKLQICNRNWFCCTTHLCKPKPCCGEPECEQ